MKRYIEKALKDYKQIKNKVDLFNQNEKANFTSFCKEMGGFNLEFWDDNENEGLFDVNYGSICATIIYKNKKCRLSNNIEIWDDENCICLYEEYIVQ